MTGECDNFCLSSASTVARFPAAKIALFPSTSHTDKCTGALPRETTFLSTNVFVAGFHAKCANDPLAIPQTRYASLPSNAQNCTDLTRAGRGSDLCNGTREPRPDTLVMWKISTWLVNQYDAAN